MDDANGNKQASKPPSLPTVSEGSDGAVQQVLLDDASRRSLFWRILLRRFLGASLYNLLDIAGWAAIFWILGFSSYGMLVLAIGCVACFATDVRLTRYSVNLVNVRRTLFVDRNKVLYVKSERPELNGHYALGRDLTAVVPCGPICFLVFLGTTLVPIRADSAEAAMTAKVFAQRRGEANTASRGLWHTVRRIGQRALPKGARFRRIAMLLTLAFVIGARIFLGD